MHRTSRHKRTHFRLDDRLGLLRCRSRRERNREVRPQVGSERREQALVHDEGLSGAGGTNEKLHKPCEKEVEESV